MIFLKQKSFKIVIIAATLLGTPLLSWALVGTATNFGGNTTFYWFSDGTVGTAENFGGDTTFFHFLTSGKAPGLICVSPVPIGDQCTAESDYQKINDFYTPRIGMMPRGEFQVTQESVQPVLDKCRQEITTFQKKTEDYNKCQVLKQRVEEERSAKYNSNYTIPTPVPAPIPKTTCPANSHEKPSDPGKCLCNTGYQANSASNGCVYINVPTYVPIPVTPVPTSTLILNPSPAPIFTKSPKASPQNKPNKEIIKATESSVPVKLNEKSLNDTSKDNLIKKSLKNIYGTTKNIFGKFAGYFGFTKLQEPNKQIISPVEQEVKNPKEQRSPIYSSPIIQPTKKPTPTPTPTPNPTPTPTPRPQLIPADAEIIRFMNTSILELGSTKVFPNQLEACLWKAFGKYGSQWLDACFERTKKHDSCLLNNSTIECDWLYTERVGACSLPVAPGFLIQQWHKSDVDACYQVYAY